MTPPGSRGLATPYSSCRELTWPRGEAQNSATDRLLWWSQHKAKQGAQGQCVGTDMVPRSFMYHWVYCFGLFIPASMNDFCDKKILFKCLNNSHKKKRQSSGFWQKFWTPRRGWLESELCDQAFRGLDTGGSGPGLPGPLPAETCPAPSPRGRRPLSAGMGLSSVLGALLSCASWVPTQGPGPSWRR